MKRVYFVLLFIALICLVGIGCGSSKSSDPKIKEEFISDSKYAEYAVVSYDGEVVIDSENSIQGCDIKGENCYSFATSYFKFTDGHYYFLVVDPSGHSFFMEFISELESGQVYEYDSTMASVIYNSQEQRNLGFYATHNSPQQSCANIQCDGALCEFKCYNVYNYSVDNHSANNFSCSSGECQYYRIEVKENSDDYLELKFRIWNQYYLEEFPDHPGAARDGEFTGVLKIDKKAHGSEDEHLVYPR